MARFLHFKSLKNYLIKINDIHFQSHSKNDHFICISHHIVHASRFMYLAAKNLKKWIKLAIIKVSPVPNPCPLLNDKVGWCDLKTGGTGVVLLVH